MPTPSMPGGLSRDDVEATLTGQETHELRDLAVRLASDSVRMAEVLRELREQRQGLQEDNDGMRHTIKMMIGHLKSNVNAQKLPETRVPENPLDVFSRFWERVRPRTSGILVSEHIGEIRRPHACASEQPALAAFGQRVTERLTGVMGLPQAGFADAASLLTGGGKDGLKPRKSEGLRQRKRHGGAEPGAAGGHGTPRGDVAVFSSFLGLLRAGVGAASEKSVEAPLYSAREPGACSLPKLSRGASACMVSTEDESTPAVEEDSTPATSAAGTAPGWMPTEEDTFRRQVEEALAGPPIDESPSAKRVALEEPKEATAARSAVAPAITPLPSASSSVLIEAALSLDEVSVAVCRVYATDRCGEVAARFVDEHSLKPCFKVPLTAWLKQAEEDAETFPIKLEADLMDIRNRYMHGA